MNILILKNPYESQPGGGGEKHTLEVAEYLRNQGHRIHFAGSCQYLMKMAKTAGFPTQWIDWAGTEAVSEGAIMKFAVSWPRIKKRYQKFLRQMKKEKQIDILYILSWNEKFLLAPIAQELGMKTLFVEHRLLERYIRLNPFKNWYLKGTETARVLAVSEAVKSTAVDLGVKPARITVITNGVDTASLDKYRVRVKKGPLPGRIGVVSRLSPEKGLDILLKAFARLRKEFPKLKLDIAGDGPERSNLEKLSQQLSVTDQVKFIGYLDGPKKLARFLSGLEVFALPSRSESFGLALAEAGYLGIPCVASNIGGTKEVIVDGETGLLVPRDDDEALARAIAKLLRDGNLRKKLGQAARERVEKNFSKGRMLAEIEKFL